MAILANDIWVAMQAILDDEGSQRYLPDQDVIPAINGGVRSFNALVGAIFAENKGGEEMFREITMTRCFQTNAYSGLVLTEAQLGHKVWSIAAIYAEPTTVPASPTISQVNDWESLYRSDVTFRKAGKFAVRRITLEQLSLTEANRFMPGTEILANGPRRNYAYVIIGNRASDGFTPSDVEIQLVPESISGRRIIAVSYLKGVDPITSLTDSIPYPASAFQLIRNLALNEVSQKQGAQPLYQITMAEVRTLLGAQS